MDVTPVPIMTATGTAQHWTARLRPSVAAPLACPFWGKLRVAIVIGKRSRPADLAITRSRT
eukprot:6618630-Pyramimonas_sp.AAC.1